MKGNSSPVQARRAAGSLVSGDSEIPLGFRPAESEGSLPGNGPESPVSQMFLEGPPVSFQAESAHDMGRKTPGQVGRSSPKNKPETAALDPYPRSGRAIAARNGQDGSGDGGGTRTSLMIE